jgi:beta-glucosidase
MKKTKKRRAVNLAAFLAVVSFGSAIAVATMSLLGAQMTNATGAYNKVYSDYASLEDAKKGGEALNKKIAAESFILMKNDGSLPLANVRNISVFGKGSANPSVAGGGSGSGNSSDEYIDIYDSLANAGYNVNPFLEDFYKNDNRSGAAGGVGGMSFGGGGGSCTIGETPVASYDGSVENSFKNYGDAALIVLRRSGSEGADTSRTGVYDHASDKGTETARSYLELSDNERAMISLVKANFAKIIVLLNTPSTMEINSLQTDSRINGIVWTGIPGDNGFDALGKVLTGEVNPSGRTVDTWPINLEDNPSYNNFGDGSQTTADGSANYDLLTSDGSSTLSASIKDGTSVTDTFVRYEEGIYVGYRYYETYAADVAATNPSWYSSNVIYPFGYGMSYTSFSENLTGVSANTTGLALTASTDVITAKVAVKNTGSVAGKDVVELYWKAPYINGGIEKADRVLAAFGKTDELAAGESQTLTLTFHLQDLASYDYSDANHNSHKGYEFDAGSYELTLNTDAHTELTGQSATLTAASAITYDKDRVTGNPIENEFTGAYASEPVKDSNGAYDLGWTPMTRASSKHLITPDAPTTAEKEIGASSYVYKRVTNVFDQYDLENGNTLEHSLWGETDQRQKTATDCAGFSQAASTVDRSTTKTTYDFKAIAGIALDDTRWTTILNDLSWDEIISFTTNGGWSNPALDAMGKETGTDLDGPSGVGVVSYCTEINIASAWNVSLATEFGVQIGNECLWSGIQGWYGPAADCHRSAFGGRNFEYYSEDPLIAGRMLNNTVEGADTKNIYCYAKHFAMNDQESSRSGICDFVTEQAVREIYLKAWQPVFEAEPGEKGCMGVMGGMNRIGTVANYSNSHLLVNILRNEWGFKGLAETDAFFGGSYKTSTYGNPSEQAVSGLNMPLGSYTSTGFFGTYDAANHKVTVTSNDGTKTATGYSIWYWARWNAKCLLYTFANSTCEQNVLATSEFAAPAAGLTAAVGVAFSKDISADTAKLGTSNVTYKLDSSTALPDGLSLSSNGALTGTPKTAGNYTFKVIMQADYWIDKTVTFAMTVNPLMAYTGATAGTVGQALTGSVSTSYIATTDKGGTYDSITYSVHDGALPTGLTLAGNGAISGTPTEAGSFTATIRLAASLTTQGWWGPTTTISNFDQKFSWTISAAAVVINTKTVVFNLNYSGSTNSTVSVNEGGVAAIPTAPTREGYVFTGWYRDAACTATYDFADAVNSDVTIYAGWKAVEIATPDSTKLAVTGIVIGAVGIVAAAGAVALIMLRKKHD